MSSKLKKIINLKLIIQSNEELKKLRHASFVKDLLFLAVFQSGTCIFVDLSLNDQQLAQQLQNQINRLVSKCEKK